MSTKPDKSYTKQYQKHITSGFCYHIKCFDDTLYSQQSVTFVKEFNDDDVAQIFIDTLEKNLMVFDDMLLEKQNTCESYYVRGRHRNVIVSI